MEQTYSQRRDLERYCRGNRIERRRTRREPEDPLNASRGIANAVFIMLAVCAWAWALWRLM